MLIYTSYVPRPHAVTALLATSGVVMTDLVAGNGNAGICPWSPPV